MLRQGRFFSKRTKTLSVRVFAWIEWCRNLLTFVANFQLNMRTGLRWKFLAWVITVQSDLHRLVGEGANDVKGILSSGKICHFDMLIRMVQSFITGNEHLVSMYIFLCLFEPKSITSLTEVGYEYLLRDFRYTIGIRSFPTVVTKKNPREKVTTSQNRDLWGFRLMLDFLNWNVLVRNALNCLLFTLFYAL